ncbi:hypothetical protein K439DRAFT_1615988 [Ramaria rubella]|nr:hypothetical protein K439DRAFT_1615988 [Ramaria rubella]
MPRHIIQKQWNTAMVRKHCKEAKVTLFICPAFDTINQHKLTLGERYAMATRKQRKQNERENKNKLPDEVELALGMKVMVTMRVDTDLNIANGSRGVIVGITLDPREEQCVKSQIVKLEYQPSYILVQLQRTRAERLEGLEDGVIPIELTKKSFKIQAPLT